jgi:hypothetical protein
MKLGSNILNFSALAYWSQNNKQQNLNQQSGSGYLCSVSPVFVGTV